MQNWKYLFENKIWDRGYFYTVYVKITKGEDISPGFAFEFKEEYQRMLRIFKIRTAIIIRK